MMKFSLCKRKNIEICGNVFQNVLLFIDDYFDAARDKHRRPSGPADFGKNTRM